VGNLFSTEGGVHGLPKKKGVEPACCRGDRKTSLRQSQGGHWCEPLQRKALSLTRDHVDGRGGGGGKRGGEGDGGGAGGGGGGRKVKGTSERGLIQQTSETSLTSDVHVVGGPSVRAVVKTPCL